jgi:hypothetical protein
MSLQEVVLFYKQLIAHDVHIYDSKRNIHNNVLRVTSCNTRNVKVLTLTT